MLLNQQQNIQPDIGEKQINITKLISMKRKILLIIASILMIVIGVLNGFLLFGQPIDQGQIINIVAVIIIIIFLITGNPAITHRT